MIHTRVLVSSCGHEARLTVEVGTPMMFFRVPAWTSQLHSSQLQLTATKIAYFFVILLSKEVVIMKGIYAHFNLSLSAFDG